MKLEVDINDLGVSSLDLGFEAELVQKNLFWYKHKPMGRVKEEATDIEY